MRRSSSTWISTLIRLIPLTHTDLPMTRDRDASTSWESILRQIEDGIESAGYWSGEARLLRDAIGAQRLGKRVGQRILAALDQAGLECDTDPIAYESETLLIQRKGAARLVSLIKALLPAIREADREVPGVAIWRDDIVATRAIRKWRPQDADNRSRLTPD
jgi:hypothetical protein